MKDLIQRNSVLLEEKKKIKTEFEKVNAELSEKKTDFEEEKELNAILSMRINYMITKKFLVDVSRVMEEVEYRHLNDSFDALVDAANASYAREYDIEE